MNGKFGDFLLKLVDKHGAFSVAAIAMFLVFTGHIPSPLTENQGLIKEILVNMMEHRHEAKLSSQQQIEIGLANCINNALIEGSVLAGNICNTSGDRQKYLIDEALEIAKEKGK